MKRTLKKWLISDLDLDLKIDLVIAYELDLLGQVILFFANELDLFIKIKEMVILNNPVCTIGGMSEHAVEYGQLEWDGLFKPVRI